MLFPSKLNPTGFIAIQTLYGFNEEIYPALEKLTDFKALGIHDAESYFDKLASPVVSKEQNLIRAVLGTQEVVGYSKSKQKGIAAYRVMTKEPKLQSIIIVVEGSKEVYKLVGSISDSDFVYLLSGLSICR